MTTGGAIAAGMTGGPIIGNTIRSAGMTGAGTTDDTIPDAMTTATAGAITMPPGMAGIMTAGRIGTGGTRAGTERDPSLPLDVTSAGETHA